MLKNRDKENLLKVMGKTRHMIHKNNNKNGSWLFNRKKQKQKQNRWQWNNIFKVLKEGKAVLIFYVWEKYSLKMKAKYNHFGVTEWKKNSFPIDLNYKKMVKVPQTKREMMPDKMQIHRKEEEHWK